MSGKNVFISYSHDSDEHRERVLALSDRLRADGIKAVIDQYENGVPAEGWPRWMLDQLEAADFILVICTETYYRRFRGREGPGKGRGVDWEGALITQEMYLNRSRTLKFVPVVFAPADENFIPEPLRGYTSYRLTSEDEYQKLYDFLLDQAGVEPHPIGELKIKPRRQGTVLVFTERPAAEIRRASIPPREFTDERVRSAAVALDQARAEKSLTMRTLVGTLDRMFERDTFRREPSVGLCTTQEWHSRLHSGMQTLLLFEAYDSFVEGEARSSLLRYRDLTAAIARYCLNMAAYLFHPPVGLSELRPLVGTVEFINQVREKKKTFEGGVDPATCREIDPHLGAAMSLMKGLHDEFWGDAESSQARPSIQDQSVVPIVPTRESREIAPESSQSSGPGPNRVFISYSADSPEHIQRVQEFAARLRADGIDVRIDTDVDLDPPEGWASYSQTQIEEATFVISICTETYRRRFDGREEPGRGKGVTFEGRLIRQEIFDSQGRTKKFIPVLLNPADEAHIPTLLRDRSRYLVTDAVSNAALNYQSLLRRLR